MSSAYIIADVDVKNPAQYEEYKRLSSIAMKAHGAQVCVRGGKVDVLEGDWQPTRITVLRFPSFEAAQAFYDAESYRAARALRLGTTDRFNMILTEGLPI